MCLVSWALSTIGAASLIVDQPLRHSDALLVLAGGAAYRERLLRAAELFRAGRSNRILLTNDGQLQSWSQTLQRNPLSVERAVLTLERLGVPQARVEILPGIMHGTSDEAFAASRYIKAHPIRSLVAVTSPYHTRRTFWMLRHALPADVVVGIDSTPTTPATPTPASWWVTAVGWRTVAPEFFKLPYYWARFGIIGFRAD
jgi:uncharacterized SAM-binding protein YcdF (DUF218 family)